MPKNQKPETSVVCIVKNESELTPLFKSLVRQTYTDWEPCFSTKQGIPQAWNDAISRAKGKILIITESDAVPLSDNWLKEMVSAVKKHGKKTLIRGIEIHPQPWCFCNLGCYSEVLKKHKLNERFSVAEDTELFSRLSLSGYKGLELLIAPVLHDRKYKGFWKTINWYYNYGKLLVMINMKYGRIGFDNKKKSNVLKRELTTIFSRISYIFGMLIGILLSKIGGDNFED